MSKLQGISPRIPLVYDQTDGPYQLNKTLKETFRQNLRMLLLTMPGERIMVPEFGVGIYGFLFDGINDDSFIVWDIRLKVSSFIPDNKRAGRFLYAIS